MSISNKENGYCFESNKSAIDLETNWSLECFTIADIIIFYSSLSFFLFLYYYYYYYYYPFFSSKKAARDYITSQQLQSSLLLDEAWTYIAGLWVRGSINK